MASCDAKNEMFRNRSKINDTAINTRIVLTVYRITLFFVFNSRNQTKLGFFTRLAARMFIIH